MPLKPCRICDDELFIDPSSLGATMGATAVQRAPSWICARCAKTTEFETGTDIFGVEVPVLDGKVFMRYSRFLMELPSDVAGSELVPS